MMIAMSAVGGTADIARPGIVQYQWYWKKKQVITTLKNKNHEEFNVERLVNESVKLYVAQLN